MKYVWLTNVLDPKRSHLEVATSHTDLYLEEDRNLIQKWLSEKSIGEPQPVEGASVEQLKAKGYVGVYKLMF